MNKKSTKLNPISNFWAFYRRAKLVIERAAVVVGTNLAFKNQMSKDIESIKNVYYGQYNEKWSKNHKLNSIVKKRIVSQNQIIIDKKINYNTDIIKNKVNPYMFFDVHFKKGTTEKQKTIFYIHGGSWASCDKKVYNSYCENWVKDGYTVVNINYRLLPDVDMFTCINDCETAIKTAIKRADVYNIDSTKIFLIGDSAGAHLCSFIAGKITKNYLYVGDNVKILGLGLYYGVFDFTDLKNDNSPILKNFYKYFHDTNFLNYDEFVKNISTTFLVDKNYPPCFVVSGEIDKLHGQSEKFYNLLEKRKVKNKVLFFPKIRWDARHAFLNFEMLESSIQARKELAIFFEEQLNNE